ncbi:MAG: flagellin [Pirellulales bacterium]
MTRINTNVGSLIAQKTLARSNSQLQESLTRLSTGLRINVGKDDPAGLIASEVLRSDIISVQRAITNSERANQIIATADSALGQVSSLLNDIRGLVSEAANTGALSDEQIAANQLQVDSSLEAIDRVAQTTSFQGRRLLDGSLDFITSSAAGSGFSTGILGGTTGAAAAGYFGDPDGASAAGTVTKAAVAAAGTLTNGADSLVFTATSGYTGAQGNGLDVTFVLDASAAGSETVDYTVGSNAVTVHIDAASTTTQIQAALAGNANFASQYGVAGTGTAVYTTGNNATDLTVGGLDLNTLTFTATGNGASYNGLDVSFVVDGTAGSETVDYTAGSNDVTVHIGAASTTTQIRTALTGNTAFNNEFTTTGTGTRTYTAANNATDVTTGGANGNRINLTAATNGSSFNGLTVTITAGAASVGAETAVYVSGTNTLTIDLHANSTVADVVTAINSQVTEIDATPVGNGGTFSAGSFTAVLSGGVDSNQFQLTALNAGTDYDNVTVNFTTDSGVTAGSEVITYDATTKILSIRHNAASTTAQVLASISADVGTLFTATALNGSAGVYSDADDATNATAGGSGAGAYQNLRIDQANFGTLSQIDVDVTVDAQATKATLVYSGGTLTSALSLQVGGKSGFEVFQFGASTTVAQIRDALNLVSDATGVTARVDGTDLVIESSEYGTGAFVTTQALNIGGAFLTTLEDGLTQADRVAGTDVALRINGVRATGQGLKASLNTSTLDLSFSVDESLLDGSNFSFSITGGGAIFQLGPDVVSNQQARLGIQGVSTATLGGVSGTLFELRSGGNKDLATDVKAAAKVVDEVITSVTGLRGRLGAFQRTTLETNIFTLNDTLANLVDAESSIRDADFAAESAKLTRAQILVQSGTSVLAIANQNPQNVLALLR